jgi:hypothetical protein
MSATSPFSTSGVLVTRMPRERAAVRSMASVPTPWQAMISSRGSAAISSPLAPSSPRVAMARIDAAHSAMNRSASAASQSLCSV